MRSRRWLCGLYLVQSEADRAPAAAASPLAAEIRLAFWSEALEGLLAGAPSSHPALRILEDAPPLALKGLADAFDVRRRELDPRPFDTSAALFAHLERSDGPVALAAARLLAPMAMSSVASEAPGAGRALGLLRLLRSRSAWAASGRDFAPTDWSIPGAVPGKGRGDRRLVLEAKGARSAFACELAFWPELAFPAAVHGALLMVYARNRRPSALERRSRILMAAVRGRI